jgi:hypothetical protein
LQRGECVVPFRPKSLLSAQPLAFVAGRILHDLVWRIMGSDYRLRIYYRGRHKLLIRRRGIRLLTLRPLGAR